MLHDAQHMTIRGRAADLLGLMGEDAKDAVPELMQALKSEPDKNACKSILMALRKIGHVDPGMAAFFCGVLKNQDDEIRESSVTILLKMNTGAADAVPCLVQALKDPDREVRTKAFDSLRIIGAPSAKTVPDLIQDLKDPDGFVQYFTVIELGNLDEVAADAVPDLLDLLSRNPQGIDKETGPDVGSLITFGPKNHFASFQDYYKDYQDGGIRKCLIEALENIGAPKPAAVPALVNYLKTEDLGLRRICAKDIVEAGFQSKEMIPQMMELLKDNDKELRSMAFDGLEKVGPPAPGMLPKMAQLLGDGDHFVRYWATVEIGRMGSSAAPAVPALLWSLKQDQDEARDIAMSDFSSGSNPANEEAGYNLARAMQEADSQGVYKGAVQAMIKIGPKAIPGLSEGLKDSNRAVRQGAEYALKSIGTPEALKALSQEP